MVSFSFGFSKRKRQKSAVGLASDKCRNEAPPPYEEEVASSSKNSKGYGDNRETITEVEAQEEEEQVGEQQEQHDTDSKDKETSKPIPKLEDKNKAADVSFSFGPDNHFFLSIGTFINYSIRQKLCDAVSLSSIAELFAVVLTEDDGAIFAYKDQNKSPTWVWSKGPDASSKISTDAIEKFYYEMAEDATIDNLAHTVLTIGPNGTYFGRTHDKLNYKLPPTLETKINARKAEAEKDDAERVYPLQVALGVNATWVVLWSDRSWSWNLGSDFEELANYFTGEITAGHVPVYVALSPYKAGDYFLVRQNGECLYSVSSISNTNWQHLHDLSIGYMQKRAKEDGTTFTVSMIRSGTTHKRVISPKTKFPIGGSIGK